MFYGAIGNVCFGYLDSFSLRTKKKSKNQAKF